MKQSTLLLTFLVITCLSNIQAWDTINYDNSLENGASNPQGKITISGYNCGSHSFDMVPAEVHPWNSGLHKSCSTSYRIDYEGPDVQREGWKFITIKTLPTTFNTLRVARFIKKWPNGLEQKLRINVDNGPDEWYQYDPVAGTSRKL